MSKVTVAILLLVGACAGLASAQGARAPLPTSRRPAPRAPAQAAPSPPAPAPAPAAALVAPVAPPLAGDKAYVVGVQDVLKIAVFDEPTLSGSFRVDADGRIQFPLLGRIQAAGQPLRQIEQTLTGQLAAGYVRRPQVSIEVEQSRSRSIFIIGEVRAPGKYPLSGQMTLIEALAAAGSTTVNASTEVVILRPRDTGGAGAPLDPDAPDQAMAQRFSVNLFELQRGRLSHNVALREGDTVFVPRAEKFFITGHVKNPGAYAVEPNLTVLQALSLAGGFSEKGSNRGIKAIRIVAGRKVEVNVKLTDLVQPGDTLVIRPRRL